MVFQFPLEQVTEVIVLGKRLSNNQVGNFGTFIKKFLYFFNFSGFYKNVVLFLRLFIVIVSVLSFIIFFRAKTPEKKRMKSV